MPDTTHSAKTRDIEGKHFIEPTAEHQVKHNHLLAIAVDYYEDDDIPNLSNCINDVEGNVKRDGLIQILTKHYFFNKENIRFLRSRFRDKGTGVKKLKDIAEAERIEKGYEYVGEATHENIIAQLKYYAQNISENDNFIICFSGHGIYDKDFDEGYWIPSDGKLNNNATFVENGTIRTALNAIKSHHTVLFSDSCYSGTLFSTSATRSLQVPRVYKNPSRWGITAGRKEPVSDGELGENSPFAKELLDILGQRREVWIGDLCNDLIKRLENNKEKQTPAGEALSFIKGHKNGQFVFLPKLATEKDYWIIAWRTNTRKGYYAFLARYPNGEYEEAALEALNVFANNKEPSFSEEALTTFDFLSEVLPKHAKSYTLKYLTNANPATISKTGLDMYRDLLAHDSKIAENELKSFVLTGENFSSLNKLEEAYKREKSNKKQKEQFFHNRFSKRNIENPYRGFEPYRERDHKLFFGRKAVVQELADKLENTNLLVITAPAFAGKTSVVQAGLFPLLKERDRYDELLRMPPGEAGPSYKLPKSITERIRADKKQLLLIDPYEELFEEEVKMAQRQSFEKALIKLYREKKQKGLKIIICLRSKYEQKMQSSDLGIELWNNNSLDSFLYRLPGMSKNEFREVILGPIWSKFYSYESEELAETILEELRSMPNALILLSFALQRLFNITKPESGLITKQKYEDELGRVQGALDKMANEELYNSLSEEEKIKLETLLIRMTNSVGGGNYTSRRVWDYELTHPNEIQNEAIQEMLQQLANNWELFTIVKDESSIAWIRAKDLLISSWSVWLKLIESLGSDDFRLLRDLAQAVAKTIRSRTDNHFWKNDPRLTRILDSLFDTDCLQKSNDHPFVLKLMEIAENLEENDQMIYFELVGEWTATRKASLDDFIEIGVSIPLLEALLNHTNHRYNIREAEFIQESWNKKVKAFMNLKQERDEAIAAKKQAERLLKEMAEQNKNLKIRNWERILSMHNKNSTIKDMFNFEVEFANVSDPRSSFITVTNAETIIKADPANFHEMDGALMAAFLPYIRSDKKPNQQLYFYLLHLRSDYSISFYEEEVVYRPDDYQHHRRLEIPLHKGLTGWALSPDEQETTSYFKLFGTTEALEYEQLTQKGLGSTRQDEELSGPDPFVFDPFKIKGEWHCITLKVTLTRS